MNVWLKTLLFLFTVVLLSQCKKEIEPNTVTIPDNNFLNALIELGVDTNGDSIISPAEAEEITFLDVSGDSISDITGIEAFVNLDTLNCRENQLTTLDVSNSTNLLYLKCGLNQLTTLYLSNCTALTELYCYNNQLTSLDVSTNTALYDLNCISNFLTSLNVSNNTALEYLNCGWNQLTTLDVSNNTALDRLYCRSNQLTNLDVSNNIALASLNCGSNQLTTLNISENINLFSAFGPWVSAIQVFLDLSYMPTLYKVCVWEMPFPPAGVGVDTTNSPNVYFTTDCSK